MSIYTLIQQCRFAKDFPEATDRLVIIDNISNTLIFDSMNAEIVREHWFFIFNQLPDLPEALIHDKELLFIYHIYTIKVLTKLTRFELVTNKLN